MRSPRPAHRHVFVCVFIFYDEANSSQEQTSQSELAQRQLRSPGNQVPWCSIPLLLAWLYCLPCVLHNTLCNTVGLFFLNLLLCLSGNILSNRSISTHFGFSFHLEMYSCLAGLVFYFFWNVKFCYMVANRQRMCLWWQNSTFHGVDMMTLVVCINNMKTLHRGHAWNWKQRS